MRKYLLFAAILGIRMLWVFIHEVPVVYVSGSVVTLEGTLDGQPEIVAQTQKFRLNGVYITTKSEPRYYYGDKLTVTGKISKNSLYYPEIVLQSPNKINGWWVAASKIKEGIEAVYKKGLPSVQAELLSGIVLGGKGVEKGVKDRLTSVGLSHIIAASGMNLTFVAGIAFFLLNPLRVKKIYKVGIAIVFISFYATITGFEPPIVRALIMSLVVTVAGLLGRQSSMTTGLAIAVFVMLWVSPRLIVNASFLLSFAAVIAQICLSGLKFPVPKVVTPVIEIFLQSLFAAIFTLPIILIFFSKFSLISVFINPVVLWTIEPLMVLGGLAGIGFKFFLLPAGVLLSYIFKMVDLASTHPAFAGLNFRFSFHENSLGLIFMGGYYLLLSVLVIKMRRLLKVSSS